MARLDWERVDNFLGNKKHSYFSYRARVPSGWLFKDSNEDDCPVIFIPDPECKWID